MFWSHGYYGRVNNGPKYLDIWIPGAYEYGTLYGTRGLTDVAKFRSLVWRHYAGLFCIHYSVKEGLELQSKRKWYDNKKQRLRWESPRIM